MAKLPNKDTVWRRIRENQCVLVLIGANEWGRKEITGLADGYRESTQSWCELLLDLRGTVCATRPILPRPRAVMHESPDRQ